MSKTFIDNQKFSICASMQNHPVDFWRRHDLYFIGASSLRNAINALPKRESDDLKTVSTAVGGLSCKPYKSPNDRIDQDLRYHFDGDLKHKTRLVIWHDIISNSNSDHPNRNDSPAQHVPEILECLRKYKSRIACIVYVRRQGTNDIFGDLLNLGPLILHAAKNLSSKRDQKDLQYLHAISQAHPEEALELQKLIPIIRHHENLRRLIQQVRSKKSKRKKRASKKE